ncbi:MAG TPA: dehydrogenase E1 component subunit alpha/beta [Vicinamibacteria bacterium]|nr:dehydrogenase E1 component subunit alpha/beta [Vicinamibacteria bacterium]
MSESRIAAGALFPSIGLDGERMRRLYRALLLPRLIEEKALLLLRQGRLSKWFSGMGQEAIAVGVAFALEPDDWILPMHRNLGVFTTRGVDLGRLFRQLFGKDGGFTKGRDRTFHFGHLEKRLVGMISHLGATVPVACGLALAAQLRGERRVAATFSGDGGTSEGDFHEAVNLAAVWKLPVLFVVENNQYGLSTPVSEQYACADLADRGIGYGIPGVVVDGNDVLAVVEAVGRAAARARAGNGPTLLEFKTFRMRGHEEASGTAYVPKHLFEEWARKDPVARFEQWLIARGLLDEAGRDRLRADLKPTIDTLVDEALLAPDPVSDAQKELADVYAPSAPGAPAPAPSAPSSELRYVDAIRDGLREVMRRRSEVVLLGQDIAEYGGVFKVTEGLVEEFGKARVRNTPIIESGAVGAALGLALDGFRPMVEMQFGDFITCGFNQIVNNLAKTRYRWGAAVPVVVRAPVGGGTGAGPFHSQNVEAWFTHVPGLKVVAPATPFDAKGLLAAAFEDGNPVLYLEHKLLYRSARERVPAGWYTVPLGQARVARTGTEATIVTYSVGVTWALEAAEALAAEGTEVEVIDLRTLLPWDRETVLASVRKTGRALVLHEAPTTGGFGAELAAVLSRDGFDWLDAPVARLGALDTPVPFSKALEEVFSPRSRVLPALRDLLSY